jgi:hypothetical protein
VHPLDLADVRGAPRLVVLTEDGECRMYEHAQCGVTIWTHGRDLDRARGRHARTAFSRSSEDAV